jgi:hypothetical protein
MPRDCSECGQPPQVLAALTGCDGCEHRAGMAAAIRAGEVLHGFDQLAWAMAKYVGVPDTASCRRQALAGLHIQRELQALDPDERRAVLEQLAKQLCLRCGGSVPCACVAAP